jgi:hypothetical protein
MIGLVAEGLSLGDLWLVGSVEVRVVGMDEAHDPLQRFEKKEQGSSV